MNRSGWICVLFVTAFSVGATAKEGRSKVDVCHVDGDTGTVFMLNVAEPALDAHLAHGDWLPFDVMDDADRDGWVVEGSLLLAVCEVPEGMIAVDDTLGFDCDDTDADINPGMEEIPYDGLDNDCDALTVDDDLDGDGYTLAYDCNDDDGDINPGVAEACDDGVDNDCDGEVDEDCSSGAVCPTVYHPNGEGCFHMWIYTAPTGESLWCFLTPYDYSYDQCHAANAYCNQGGACFMWGECTTCDRAW